MERMIHVFHNLRRAAHEVGLFALGLGALLEVYLGFRLLPFSGAGDPVAGVLGAMVIVAGVSTLVAAPFLLIGRKRADA